MGKKLKELVKIFMHNFNIIIFSFIKSVTTINYYTQYYYVLTHTHTHISSWHNYKYIQLLIFLFKNDTK